MSRKRKGNTITPDTISPGWLKKSRLGPKAGHKLLAKALGLLMAACIVLSALLSGFHLVTKDTSFLEAEIGSGEALSMQERTAALETHKNLMGYLLKGKTLDSEPYSERELLHLQDVKSLFYLGRAVYFSSLALFACLLAAGILFLPRPGGGLKVFSRVLIYSGAAGIVLILLILVCGIWFHESFVVFHKVFFPNDYWMLNPGDTLLVLYPECFWSAAAARALTISLLNSVFVLIAGLAIRMPLKSRAF